MQQFLVADPLKI